jgi:hypothetical protein
LKEILGFIPIKTLREMNLDFGEKKITLEELD